MGRTLQDLRPETPPQPDSDDHDQELIELLNELRVVLPGVQVLFAFLLVVPFSEGFKRITEGQRGVFFLAFACTTAACILLIAPSAYHRIAWRRNHKEHVLRYGNRLVVLGLGLLAAAIAATVYLIISVIIGSLLAAIVCFTALAMMALLWFLIPVRDRE